jgi:hypothetical protein
MNALLELAERCEQATGPDRELDVRMGEAIDLQAYEGFGIRDTLRLGSIERAVEMAESHQNIWNTALPRYTASLDAAMTLVDDEGYCAVKRYDKERPRCWAYVGDVDFPSTGIAATPALALCAAALRARAASADTLPKGQDAQQGLAGTESGAIGDSRDAQTQWPNLSQGDTP